MTNSTYFSIRDHTFDDSINQYTTPSYNDVTNIEVTLNGTVLTTPTDYSIGGTTLTFTSSLMSSASDGDAIRIRRKTNPQTRSVNFEDGSVLKADTLDLDSNELFYMAQEAKDAAESAVADYNARYYGSLKVAPTSPAPSIGDLWYDTTNNVMKVYASAGWQQSTSAVGVTHTERVVYTVGTASGNYAGSSTSTFPVTYDSGYVDVYLNGVKQVLGSDFTASDGANIVLTPAASSGDLLDIVAYGETSLESELRDDVNGKLDKAGGTLTGNLNLGSTKKINIGDNNDLQLYHNGTSSFIHEVGDGFLGILGADIVIANSDASKNYLAATDNASLSLYYDGSPKLNTTSDGIGVTGTISATGYNDSNWNTAYGWGDHAQAGYLTSYTETDPVFSAHAASGVTTTKISNWDSAYNDKIASATFNTSDGVLTLNQQDGGSVTVDLDGRYGVSSGISLADNQKATFGASDDLEIYHDSSDNHSYIAETNESGSLFIKGTHIYLQNSTGQDALNLINGNAYIKSGGNTKLETTSTGIDVTGDITLSNTLHLTNASTSSFMQVSSNILQLGTSSADPVAFYSGNSERMRIGATGDITQTGGDYIYSGGINWDLKHTGAGQNIAFSTTPTGGSATERLRIKSDGNVGINDTNPARKLTVQGGSGDNLPVRVVGGSGTTKAHMEFQDASTTADYKVTLGSEGDEMTFQAGGEEKMRIDASGNVGIGTSNPDRDLKVQNTSSNPVVAVTSSTTGSAYLGLGDTDNSLVSFIRQDNNSGNMTHSAETQMIFNASGSERMRIDASGNLLVGTTDASVYNNNSNSTVDNGFNVSSTGQFYGAKSGASVGILNRTSSDGSILEFRKSGAIVGSIGVSSSDNLTVGSSASGHAGFELGNQYLPLNGGSASDGELDLGSSSRRFKDLYLSGTVTADKVDLGINSVIANTGYTTPSITMKSWSNTSTAPTTHISFTLPDGTQKGKITSHAYSTTYSTSSDYRLKEDIQDVPNATSRTLALNPCNFQWIGTSERVDGFLAHEVAGVVPEAVVGEKDAVDADGNPDYQSIDQSKLVPLLVKTIQELEARIATLENK